MKKEGAKKVNPANPPLIENKPNPLSEAKFFLERRLVEKNGAYWLDGSPVKTARVIQEYNRIRIGMGLEQILDNPSWEYRP